MYNNPESPVLAQKLECGWKITAYKNDISYTAEGVDYFDTLEIAKIGLNVLLARNTMERMGVFIDDDLSDEEVKEALSQIDWEDLE